MKKIISIRALLIALMLVLTFAIPVLVSAKNLAATVDVAEAAPIVVPAEISTIDTSETTPGATVLPEEISTLDDDTSDLSEDVVEDEIEESTETESVSEVSPSPLCDYCGSQNHSYAYCAQRAIDNGAVGRWSIPSVGINVATYQGVTGDAATNQEVCDRWDSAVYWLHYCTIPVIADHSNQEFSTLKYVSVGDYAYMDYGSYAQSYICTKVIYGHNNDGLLCDDNWTPLYTYDYNVGGITCYTCNGNSYNILLVCFQPVYD